MIHKFNKCSAQVPLKCRSSATQVRVLSDKLRDINVREVEEIEYCEAK